MNKKLFILLLFSVNGLTSLIAQDLAIFDLELRKNESVGFISLSDVYPLSERPDSLAIPNLEDELNDKLGKLPENPTDESIEKVKDQFIKNAEYFILSSKYRKIFLSKTKILETDLVFIYDYSLDVLISFTVKNLNIVACLNIYGADWPYSQNDYMIGFEINKKFLTGFGKYPSNTLVYVGKENPFVQGQLKHIVWKKIETTDFPTSAVSSKDTSELREYFRAYQYVTGTTYKYEKEGLQYFIQDFIRLQDNFIPAKRLIVIDLKTKETIFNKHYFSSEGTSFAPLNNQWTGKLFKNKPPVIFGFQYESFGCPSITLLDSMENEVGINCDSRH